MSARDDLDAWLDDVPIEIPDGDEAPPIPADADEANRWLRRLARLDADAAEVEAIARAEIDRVTAWKADRLSGIDRARSWAESVLDGWTRAQHAAGGAQSVSLPNGTVALRRAPAGSARPLVIEVGSDVEIQAWLARLSDAHPTWVKERLSLDKNAVKAATTPDGAGRPVTADGEVIEGLRYVEPAGPYTFSVKAAVR